MKQDVRKLLDAEHKCITNCIDELSKLGELILKDGGGCSVSRKQARRAQIRVFNYLQDYANDKTDGDTTIGGWL